MRPHHQFWQVSQVSLGQGAAGDALEHSRPRGWGQNLPWPAGLPSDSPSPAAPCGGDSEGRTQCVLRGGHQCHRFRRKTQTESNTLFSACFVPRGQGCHF